MRNMLQKIFFITVIGFSNIALAGPYEDFSGFQEQTQATFRGIKAGTFRDWDSLGEMIDKTRDFRDQLKNFDTWSTGLASKHNFPENYSDVEGYNLEMSSLHLHFNEIFPTVIQLFETIHQNQEEAKAFYAAQRKKPSSCFGKFIRAVKPKKTYTQTLSAIKA